ncbi:MAG: cbb3-type cytochrome c oxidase subunit 3 [Chromatiales bacterium]|jgi:cytochrome c oxidase cbb3-type subunit 4|nr:cbb3-type cytochrome c oxidase subunit 3 [Chromatiales bacterium]
MDGATFHSIYTVVLLVIFIGIVIWAWSGRRKRDFDEASRLPLEDEQSSRKREED